MKRLRSISLALSILCFFPLHPTQSYQPLIYATIGPEAPAILQALVNENQILRVPAGQQMDLFKQHQIAALIVPEEWMDENELAALRKLNVLLIRVKRHTSIVNMLDNIEQLAVLTHTESVGSKWVNDIKEGIHGIRAEVTGLSATRTLTLTPEGYTEGQGALITELIGIAGGINTAAEAGIPEARQIDDVQIRTFAPEIVLLINWSANDAAEFTHSPLLATVPAFKKHHLYRTASLGKAPTHLLDDLHLLVELLHQPLL